jgi:hypothetical protein
MSQANAACTSSTGLVLGIPVKIAMASSDIPMGAAAASPLSGASAPVAALASAPHLGPGILGAIPAPPAAVLGGPPSNAQTYHEKQDEIARTIYVGNVNSTVPAPPPKDPHFEKCRGFLCSRSLGAWHRSLLNS